MGKRLRDGITARLEYDFACERGHGFGEYHLHGVINEIVTAIIDPAIFKQYGGYAHPALNKPPRRAGRPREVDFYVEHRETKEGRTCLEAKWAGSSHCTWDNILRDLYRLAFVKEHSPTIECLLVLAGSTANVDLMMKTMPAVWQNGNIQRRMRPLQKPENKGHASLRYYNPVPWAVPISVKEALPGTPLPFSSKLAHHTKLKDSRWRTVVWKVE